MPSKSKAQKRLMAAVANNPKFAKKVGVPQSVGREFANADTRKKEMPSKYNSTANKPGKAVKKGYVHGGMARGKRVLRNLDDEDYRIRNRTGGNTDAERRRINREKEFEVSHMKKGGKVQGYDARQDESLGTRNKTKGQQNLKSRRDEAAAMEKRGEKRKYSDVSTMDKGVVKKRRGGSLARSSRARTKPSRRRMTTPTPTASHGHRHAEGGVVKKRRGGSLRTDADRRQGTEGGPRWRPTPAAPTPTPTPSRGHAKGGTVTSKGSAPKGWGIATKGWR